MSVEVVVMTNAGLKGPECRAIIVIGHTCDDLWKVAIYEMMSVRMLMES